MATDQAPTLEHKHLESRGLTFCYVDVGPKDAPAIVLLHGFPCSHKMWALQIPGLQQAGFRVIAPDLRGYGDTEPKPDAPDTYTIDSLVEDVAGILDALHVQRAVIVGHDWGAALAWAFAAAKPERTALLCAMAVGHPAGIFAEPHGHRQRQMSWLLFQFKKTDDFLRQGGIFKLFPADKGQPTSPPPRWLPLMQETIQDLQKPGTITGGLNWYRANVGPESFMGTDCMIKNFPEARVQCPVLGIMPTKDQALCVEQMRHSSHFVDDWQYEELDTTHMVPFEKPDELNSLLLAFIDKHKAKL